MDIYIRQKADQAFEELLKDAPLVERLKMARAHLLSVCSDHYYGSASEPVVEALKAVWDLVPDAPWPEKASKVRAAITEVIKAGVVDDVDPKPWQR
jgi:hypothetical protein